jgi:prevent-host-death family protein
MATHMSAKDARDQFSDVLNRVYYQREPIVVERQGKPMAVVVSLADFERYQQLAKERFFQAVDQVQARTAGHDPEEVLRDVSEAVDDVRRDTYGHGA